MLDFLTPVRFVLGLVAICGGLTSHVGSVSAALILQSEPSGIVIERVNRYSEAELAGLRPGDTVQRWRRGDATGVIQTPFDLWRLEYEEAPVGLVLLDGASNNQVYTWKLGQGDWGINARPILPEKLLELYLEGKTEEEFGKPKEAAIIFWKAASEFQLQANLGCWLSSRAAETYTAARQWKEADLAYQQAVSIASAESLPVRVELLHQRGLSYLTRGDLANAEKSFQESLAMLENDAKHPFLTARTYQELSDVDRRRGNLVLPRQYGAKAIEILEKLAPESRALGWTLSSQVQTDLGLADLAAAESHAKRALAIEEKVAPFTIDRTNSIASLGIVAWRQGDLVKAEAYYLEASKLIREIAPGHIGNASGLNNLGLIARARGDYERAERYFQDALEAGEKAAPGTPVVAATLNNFGDLMRETGNFDRAQTYLQRSLAIKEKLGKDSVFAASTLINFGQLSQAQGNVAEAERQYSRALEIKKKAAPGIDVSEILADLGEISNLTGKPEKAEEYYRQALDLTRRLAPRTLIHAEILASLGSLALKRKQADIAGPLLQQALEALESQSSRLGGSEDVRSGFRARHARFYKDYIELLLSSGETEQAFQVLERFRGRTLLEDLGAGRIDLRAGVDPTLVAQERALRAEINAKSDLRIRLINTDKPAEQSETINKADQCVDFAVRGSDRTDSVHQPGLCRTSRT